MVHRWVGTHRLKYKSLPTLVGVRNGRWKADKNSLVLIQGSARFSKKMLSNLESIGITPTNHKIIISSAERISKVYNFTFQRLSHRELGGVTDGIGFIGFSKQVRLQDSRSLKSKTRRTMLGALKVTQQGSPCESPFSGRPLPEGALNPREYHPPKDVFTSKVIAPSAYTITKWWVREVVTAEFLEMMDIPASVVKHASEHNRLKQTHAAGLLSSPPLKILQEVGFMLFGRDATKVEAEVMNLPLGADVTYNLRSQLPGMDEIYKEIDQAKAAKNDDAVTNFALWEEVIMKKPSDWRTDWAIVGRDYKHDYARKHFDTLRGGMHKRYLISVELSYKRYMKEEYGEIHDRKVDKEREWNYDRDVKAGKEAMRACKGSTFWDWNKGSFPYYWRWQPEVQKDLRDGTKLWVEGKLPKNKNKQRRPKEKHVILQMIDKLEKVRERWYIAPGWVGYFPVPKGESDIRLVYDMSASGFNAVLWVPGFWLPSVYNVLLIHSLSILVRRCRHRRDVS